jgi:hypothetical protein
MIYKLDSDPVGHNLYIPEIEQKVDDLIVEWDEKSKEIGNKSWSKWVIDSKIISFATKFILFSLDELVVAIDKLTINGPNKKSTVLSSIDKIYDHVVREAFPLWLVPFSNVVKAYIIYTLLSNLIDYIVAKYRNGSWRNKEVV